MKFLKPALPCIFLLFLFSCKNSDADKNNNSSQEKEQTAADSLFDEVMEGHNDVMPRMNEVKKASKEAQRLIDSIKALPPKVQSEAAALQAKLERLLSDLVQADGAMNQWMEEFNIDSASEDAPNRIQYLADEKIKVLKVKEAILGGLAKADTLLYKR